MIIRHNFYTELKEEFEECARAAQQQEAENTEPSGADHTDLFEYMLRTAQFRRFRKAAEKQSLTQNVFKRLSDSALQTAERLGLNLLIETRGLVGQIALSAPRLSLGSDGDSIHISRLLTLLSSADHFCFETLSEDGEALVCLRMYYDLAL